MAKIILGKRPKTFTRTLGFKMLDGTPGSMEVTYTYRTRSEFGEFADAIRAKVNTDASAELDGLKELAAKGKPIPELTQTEMLARETATNVGYIMNCVEGWNLDVPFDKAAVEQLADEVPAAIIEIISTYRDAITEGRAGN